MPFSMGVCFHILSTERLATRKTHLACSWPHTGLGAKMLLLFLGDLRVLALGEGSCAPTRSSHPATVLSSLFSPLSLSVSGMKWNRTKSPTQSNSDRSFRWKHSFGHFPPRNAIAFIILRCLSSKLICIHSEGRIHMYILSFATESAML